MMSEEDDDIRTIRTDAQHLAIITGALITAYFTIFTSELKTLREEKVWFFLYLVPTVLWFISLIGYVTSGLHTDLPEYPKAKQESKEKKRDKMKIWFVLFILGIVSMFVILICYSFFSPIEQSTSSIVVITCSPLASTTPCPPTPTSVNCPDIVKTPSPTIIHTAYP